VNGNWLFVYVEKSSFYSEYSEYQHWHVDSCNESLIFLSRSSRLKFEKKTKKTNSMV
jgi:hypothetical protein